MTREEFRALTESKIVVLDGATGSMLQQRGMPVGVCPEQWILENPEVMIGIQMEYIEAGTDIIYSPTFTSNRVKLSEYGLEKDGERITKELTAISKEAIRRCKKEGKVFVAGDISMTGIQVAPIGPMDFEELVDIYKEQIKNMLGNIDLIVIETMMSLQECRAAVLAAKETCDLPVMVSLSYNEDGRTMYGTNPETAMVVLQSLGADAVGVNCSTGPDKLHDVLLQMKQYAKIPMIVKPNAGLPTLRDGQTVYSMEPEEFAKEMEQLAGLGAGLVGGCCGTSPEYIRMLCEAVKHKKPQPIEEKHVRVLASERMTLPILPGKRFYVIGERINPTGKKALQAELREGCFDMVSSFAEEQEQLGADILDVNMGTNGIDEKECMLKAIEMIQTTSNLPMSIDSSYVSVVEAALRRYPGRALINSISLETEKFEKLLPLARKYGAMFILLPLSDAGLPKDIEEKKEIIHKILERALALGLKKEDIVVDALVNTVGANKRAAIEALETITYCRELSLATACGLSNISFGLPQRQLVNSTFFAFAIKEGLTMAIANPSQDLLMSIACASDLLLAREDADLRYIDRVTSRPPLLAAEKKPAAEKQSSDGKTGGEETSAGSMDVKQHPVFQAVVKGKRGSILELVKKEVAGGKKPSELLDSYLIPAINEVGDLFDKQIYFLPQLITSAETMKKAVEYLEPMLGQDGGAEDRGTIVIATVEGDIHDIGKNLVVLMLKNYGYHVVDLGKDVKSDDIIEAAQKEHADIIALSALMTTTMVRMKEVVDKKNEAGLHTKVIIGGAVTTQGYAEEIGADGYSEDAQAAVRLVERLLQERTAL